jgi:poly-gamma-glutamate synthesis protein (capsule biosynthesis protein)
VSLCGIAVPFYFEDVAAQSHVCYPNFINFFPGDRQMMKRILSIIIISSTLLLSGCNSQDAATTAEVQQNTEIQQNSEVPQETQSQLLETAESPESSEPTVSLVMVGDILLHTQVAESGLQEDGSYNFDAIFANMTEEIAAADLALVNQEVIIGGTELGISGYPSFNAPYELGDALVDAGFNVALHATNHALDKGKKGINNCISYWEENHPEMAVLGIHQSQEAQDAIYVYEQNGIRIAVLNYTYGTNGISLPSDMPYAVDLLEKDKVIADIAAAKEQADFVIVCPHWGTEYNLATDSSQEKWTQIFLENGVDLVIGTHPHVIEPIEWVSDDAGNEMLVYDSLGNFVNWTSGTGDGVANRMVGGMAELTIAMDENGEAFIQDYGVEAVVCHLTEGTNGVTVYPLSEYTDELAEENAIVAQDGNFSREYCVQLCDDVWGEGMWH